MEVTHLNSKTELVRSVHHYQYKKWKTTEDIPASMTSFVEFVEVAGAKCYQGAMCVLHCEYGTGRSGLFLISEVMRNEVLSKKEPLDLFGIASKVCAHRGSLLDNVYQYKFIHTFIVESTFSLCCRDNKWLLW